MRVNEQGRSMIEMLGVLAIVGVLSVGGIAGYSKAMNKFKTNKAIDQINMLSTNIRTLFSSQGNYQGMTNKVLIKAGVIPAEMYTLPSGGADAFAHSYSGLTNVFGGSAYIKPASHNGTNDSYIIAVNGIPQSACVVMASTDWGSDVGSGLAAMYISGATTATAKTAAEAIDTGTEAVASAAIASDTGTIFVPGDDAMSTPLSIISAQSACGTGTNAFAFKYI